jgi:hypothetical protein
LHIFGLCLSTKLPRTCSLANKPPTDACLLSTKGTSRCFRLSSEYSVYRAAAHVPAPSVHQCSHHPIGSSAHAATNPSSRLGWHPSNAGVGKGPRTLTCLSGLLPKQEKSWEYPRCLVVQGMLVNCKITSTSFDFFEPQDTRQTYLSTISASLLGLHRANPHVEENFLGKNMSEISRNLTPWRSRAGGTLNSTEEKPPGYSIEKYVRHAPSDMRKSTYARLMKNTTSMFL